MTPRGRYGQVDGQFCKKNQHLENGLTGNRVYRYEKHGHRTLAKLPNGGCQQPATVLNVRCPEGTVAKVGMFSGVGKLILALTMGQQPRAE